MFELGPLAIGLTLLYVLFIVAVAVLVVLAIIALVLSIRLLRIRIAEAAPPTGPDDGVVRGR